MRPEAHGQICRTDPCERCLEALLRAHEALEHIERAQAELYLATEKLSALVGVLPLWKRSFRLANEVKALWHRVRERSHGVKLDGISIPRPSIQVRR